MLTISRAERPLQAVFIDHIKVDVVVVDETRGDALGQPWLTLAFDSLTRMVTGFHLAMTPPSRISVGLCLLHSVCNKNRWLGERGVDAHWPVSGLPETICIDANSFYGLRKFGRACKDMAMEAVIDNARQPTYGARIQAFIGSRLGDVTLSTDQAANRFEERDTRVRPNLRHQTLRELERDLASEIASDYHCRRHQGLRSAPIDAWRNRQSTTFRTPADCLKFRLSFLPEEECTIHDDGVHLLGRVFWSRAVAKQVEAGATRLTVKYYPRDLSHVFVRSPTGRFFKAKCCADSLSRDLQARSEKRPTALQNVSGAFNQRLALPSSPRRTGESQTAFVTGSAEFLERKCLASCPFAGTARRARAESLVCC
jgi:putative transposase